jgi:hypothetical protein
MNCINTSQMMAVQPIAEADAPAFAHGEAAESPTPVPNATRASDKAAATNAPAITAPQDTPELFESLGNAISVDAGSIICAHPSLPISIWFRKTRGSLAQASSALITDLPALPWYQRKPRP